MCGTDGGAEYEQWRAARLSMRAAQLWLRWVKWGSAGRPNEARAQRALRKSTAMTTSTGLEVRRNPGDAEVRAALERVVASDTFRTSPQLGAFLRFIVEAVLSGRGASLKGYTIGVEALGRDHRFDPQIDPIVRVEATRLRRALGRYYGGMGADDPIVIELPRGSYVPTFRHLDALSQAPARASPAKPASLYARAPHPLAILAV